MKNTFTITLLALILFSCSSTQPTIKQVENDVDFTIAFGSCNRTDRVNNLWDDVLIANPDVWIWGGDIIYADTEDASKIDAMYKVQNEIPLYKELKAVVPVIGTWDDHDYGLNDGGVEFVSKKESQQVFLDFMGVSKESPRRTREGVYAVHDYNTAKGNVKILVLDTRYFRTALTPDNETKRRTKPNVYGEGTILGAQQWQWLENELNNSKADFNVIVSSVQFLSNKHGFECWGNFPHEVDKLNTIINTSKAKGVMVLSGDRHISEFSKNEIDNVNYPIVDFTSSGLTHVYSAFSGEENPYRVGAVVSKKSFGLVKFNFETKKVAFEIVGDGGEVLGELEQNYN